MPTTPHKMVAPPRPGCATKRAAEAVEKPVGANRSRNQGAAHDGRLGRVIGLGFVLGWTLLTAGCATVPIRVSPPYFIAVRYDVEPQLVVAGRAPGLDVVRRDFQNVKELGFNGAVLWHVEDADRTRLMDLARDAGLVLAVPDRRCHRFVLTGALPAECSDAGDLARAIPREIIDHPAFRAVAVGPALGQPTAERAVALCTELRRRNVDCVVLLGEEVGSETGGLAEVDVARLQSVEQASPLELWLAQFHAGLMAGRTTGVVVDRYYRPPGDPPALSSPLGSLARAQSAALQSLLTRARHWGAKLCGLSAQPVTGVATEGMDVAVVELKGRRRRYILVLNFATDRFARGRVLLPEGVDGTAARRAVEVPPSADRGLGHVVDAHNGRLALSVALRPGDAALFEIF